jgi:NAD(P)-dependent dehydrogenase (short-subunit alcohol dehydrogenase family)
MKVLVTGGSRGIGAAVVRALSARGDEVLAVGRDRATLDRVCGETGATPLVLDVLDASTWATVGRVDGLVCAAGSVTPIGPLGSYEPEAFWNTMTVNVLGTLLPIHHLQPRCVVTFSGGGATSPRPNYDAYATSKTAVVRLTENLAAGGLTINAVAPGIVATDMHRATLEAGAALAGDDFQRTSDALASGGFPASEATELTTLLLDDPPFSGKLISAQWDPWRDASFQRRLAEERDLGTLRRIDDQFFTALDR